MADDDGMLDLGDASAIGFKIVEMCDRVTGMAQFVPAAAKWHFDLDGTRFEVMVRIVGDAKPGV